MKKAYLFSVVGALALYWTLGAVGFGYAAGKGKPPPPSLGNSAIVYLDGESIKVADKYGGNQATLLTRSGTQFYHPSWSPDGNTIIFGSDLNGAPGIYRMKIHRESGLVDPPVKIIAINSEAVSRPQWSPQRAPDGEYKIAYEDWDGSRYFIKLIGVSANGDPIGTPFRLSTHPRLGHEVDWEYYPTWSPDASNLAITTRSPFETLSCRDCRGLEIITLGTDTCGYDPVCEVATRRNLVDELLPSPFGAYSPSISSWANEGNNIAVSGIPEQSGNFDVWVIEFDDIPTNTTIRNLTNTNNADPPDRHEATPVWSPDDMQIMYAARNDLCEQPKNNKPQRTADLIIRNVNGDPIDGCEEKMIVKSGRHPNWWRGLGQ